jgi:enoyl-CoA hydratase/carnithine racemase
MSPIRVEANGATREIVLDRAGKRNALRDQDFETFTRMVRELDDGECRAVLIRGEGEAFCAGRDIATTDPSATDGETLIRDTINPLFTAIRAISVPTVAAVQGHCLGGGFGIAFACDIVLVAESAKIGSPFRNLGLIADSATHHWLREALGYHRASELIYTGRLLSGQEAADLGLVSRAYPDADLLPAARALAAEIAAGPTAAFKVSKRILQESADFGQVLELEAVGQGRVLGTRDGAEGFRAFQEKRRPHFLGH